MAPILARKVLFVHDSVSRYLFIWLIPDFRAAHAPGSTAWRIKARWKKTSYMSLASTIYARQRAARLPGCFMNERDFLSQFRFYRQIGVCTIHRSSDPGPFSRCRVRYGYDGDGGGRGEDRAVLARIAETGWVRGCQNL